MEQQVLVAQFYAAYETAEIAVDKAIKALGCKDHLSEVIKLLESSRDDLTVCVEPLVNFIHQAHAQENKKVQDTLSILLARTYDAVCKLDLLLTLLRNILGHADTVNAPGGAS